jgi:glycosyltransferase involved in cell wall biosynthesis
MNTPPLLCWILVSSVPYHEARFSAVAERAELRLCMIQLTEVDAFAILQQPKPGEGFVRYTLFPDTPLDKIDGRDLVRRLHEHLNALDPSAVCINGWSFGGSLAALSWCLTNRVPAIVMSESTAADEPRHWWKEAIKRRIVRLCSAAVVGGGPHRDYLTLLGLTRDRIFTGYDSVDNEHFRRGAEAARRTDVALRAQLALPARYFLACSRFSRKKNIATLLRGYAEYRKLTPPEPWSLVIIGDGELKDEIVALRNRLGLTAHVQLPGAKSYSELPSYYGLASAFVHASTTEQWGLVVNEAMASGLPVLVSNCCGCARDLVIPPRNGFLFDPYDPQTLADAMTKIASDQCDLATMGRASDDIIERWSPARFAENLLSAARTALASERPASSTIDRLLLKVLSGR